MKPQRHDAAAVAAVRGASPAGDGARARERQKAATATGSPTEAPVGGRRVDAPPQPPEAATPPLGARSAPRRAIPLPLLVVDTREQRPLTFTHLAAERGTLATGDYSVDGLHSRFAVERKSVPDLVGSLTQGRERFFRELERMRGMDFARLLIVGRPIDLAACLNRRAVTTASILGSLEAINARLVPVVWEPTPERAALAVERWACYYYAGAAKPWGNVAIPAWCREGAI